MNSKRLNFLRNNPDPSIPIYIKDAALDGIIKFEFSVYFHGNKKFLLLYPYKSSGWTEDKIWVRSHEDAIFFVKWYNEKRGTAAELTPIGCD